MNRIITVFVVAAALALTPIGFAQEASDLDVSEAEAFVGAWTVNLDGPLGPLVFSLDVSDVSGMVGVKLNNDILGEATVTDITKAGDDLNLQWEGNGIPLTMTLTPDGDGLQAVLDFGQGQAEGLARQGPAPVETAQVGPPGRTRDGQPDIQGTWRKSGAGTRESVDYEQIPVTPNNTNPYPQLGIFDDGTVGFRKNPSDTLFTERVIREGVVDLEPDGTLPWQDWAHQERMRKGKLFADPESLLDVQPIARCMAPSINMLGSPKILQPPGYVVLLYEGYHVSRVIPLDRRPHLSSEIRLFTGNSRGRWEGNTLVVETSNFTGMTWHDMTALFESDVMNITERFTVLDADTMSYEVTVDDPKLFTRTWTTAGTLTRRPSNVDSEFLDDDCVEGQEIGKQLESILYKLGRDTPTSR